MKKNLVLKALTVALVLSLAACSNPSGGGSGGGGSTDPALEQVSQLPSYTGASVSSESEVSTLASAAFSQITAAIATAMSHPSPNTRVAANGTYSYNGVTLQYAYSTGGSYPSYPYTMNITEKVTIDGIYNGYTIKGTGLDIKFDTTATSSTQQTVDYTYNCAFTVSYNGKGMKLLQTGTMQMTLNGSAYTYVYKLHYKAYDNSNKLLFSFDYDVTQ